MINETDNSLLCLANIVEGAHGLACLSMHLSVHHIVEVSGMHLPPNHWLHWWFGYWIIFLKIVTFIWFNNIHQTWSFHKRNKRSHISFIVNLMASDKHVTKGARVLAVMLLTEFIQHILLPTQKMLCLFGCWSQLFVRIGLVMVWRLSGNSHFLG